MNLRKNIIFCIALLILVWYEAIGQVCKPPAACDNLYQTHVKGVLVSPDYFITCYHFVEYANRESIMISFSGNKRLYGVTVIDSNMYQDWVLLKIKGCRISENVVKYGVTKRHCLDAFVIDSQGGITSSGIIKRVGDNYYYVQGKVNPSQYKTPEEGEMVMDNDGNCVGIVTQKLKDGAKVLDIYDICQTLSRHNIVLNKSISTDTKSQAASYAKEAIVNVDLTVNGGLLYSSFCDNYRNGLDEMDAHNYVDAVTLFTNAKLSDRIPDNNDLDEKISVCNYWIHRNKGDEYAASYDLQRAKNEYYLAFTCDVDYSLKYEMTQRKNALDVFATSVSNGDSYYSIRDYKKALSEYKRAASADVRPTKGSLEMESLNKKITRTESKLRNSQKRQFVELNAVPSWAFGLTYGIRPQNTGWYITLLSNINFDGLGSDLKDGDNGSSTYSYTGTESAVFLAAHTGLLFKLGSVVSLKLGLGYGIDNLYKKNTSEQWIKYIPGSKAGLLADAGLMFWVGTVSFSADVLACGEGFSFGSISIKPQFGIGLRF